MIERVLATSDETVRLQGFRLDRLRKPDGASAQAWRIFVAVSLGLDHLVPSCCRISGIGLLHDSGECLEYLHDVSKSAAARQDMGTHHEQRNLERGRRPGCFAEGAF
jgi:hypothetical protein